jgi:uncharacterized protein YdeI (YjbR/CyaY-like superfamily)
MLEGPLITIEVIEEWRAWLEQNATTETEVWCVILKKSTKRQRVEFMELLEEGFCWGWVDVKTKRVDDDWYGIRFVPRRPKSNWTARNREIACELIASGRMQPPGYEKLPTDITCPE